MLLNLMLQGRGGHQALLNHISLLFNTATGIAQAEGTTDRAHKAYLVHTYLPPVLLCCSTLQYPHNNHPHLIIPVDHLSTSDIPRNHITLSANTQNIEAFIVHLDVANSYNVYIVYQLKAKQAAPKSHARS